MARPGHNRLIWERVRERVERTFPSEGVDFGRAVAARLDVVAEKLEIRDWSLERARLSAAPHIVSSDLRHGCEAALFQNSDAQSFFRNRRSVSAACYPLLFGSVGPRRCER